MTKRKGARTAPRCAECNRLATVCVCNDGQPLQLRTQLCVVAHTVELEKTTNTGSVAARFVAGSSVVVHGIRNHDGDGPRDAAAPEPDFTGRRPLILFPSEGAEVLTPEHGLGAPVTLVVPDGTWAQARRMHARIPWMGALQHVTLPEGAAPSAHRLRTSPSESRLATLEAIAVALGILEGREVRDFLEGIYALLVERTLAARGTPITSG